MKRLRINKKLALYITLGVMAAGSMGTTAWAGWRVYSEGMLPSKPLQPTKPADSLTVTPAEAKEAESAPQSQKFVDPGVQPEPQYRAPKPVPQAVTAPAPSVSWLRQTMGESGLSFMYPQDWQIEKNADNQF